MATAPMEHDMAKAGRSSLGKRKAEVENLKDSGDTEKVEASSYPHYWGYDNYEGRAYPDFSSDEFSDEETNQKYLRYVRQCYESQGFDVPSDISSDLIGAIRTCSKSGHKVLRKKLNCARVLVGEGTEIQFDHVGRLNTRGANLDVKLYITFMAKDLSNGALVEFQAKTERVKEFDFYHLNHEHRPIFCRPKPIKQ
ncbi:PREDICTED: uncharacterized protein LOC109116327 [Tarenaya hassleriana]|uniref:uncharacterized protein LOC109116327 n=1 Tax=Tarenaya hassleriana TaxID=28532 RepID=UPI0008FD50E0|nr:PREDICTED: uncharacterized protein LOC109116327 [Tarenaya hassleriana]